MTDYLIAKYVKYGTVFTFLLSSLTKSILVAYLSILVKRIFETVLVN